MADCKERIFGDYRWHGCSNKAKKDGYCGVHHPDAVAKRKAKTAARLDDAIYNSPSSKLRAALEKIKELEAEIKELRL